MQTFLAIVVACVAGGLLSVLLAALLSLGATAARVPLLVSFAVGALLGAVFLEILPYAFERASSIEAVTATVLGGILAFFVLEKLVLWRHCHVEDCEAHDPPGPAHDHGRSGALILIGDTFHNFVDGILIAAAFLADFQLGLVAAVAIITHEIPQELSNFVILLHSGYSRRKALGYNLLTGLAMVVGGLIGYLALTPLMNLVPLLVAVAAASMLYVAVADLIPGLHRRAELSSTLQQSLLIGLGVGTIWLVGSIAGH
ncbi:MAG: ZIP family metal transporter [Burkholderiales bacterium]|nr:ZIP family metal transporter [Burkholderiales bacterium]